MAASGFSTSTGIPRSMAASASGTWAVVGAATTAASMSASRIIASGSANPAAPVWDVAASSAAASGSATAARIVSGWPAITRRWFLPIEPRPASPTRIRPSLIGPTGVATSRIAATIAARSSADSLGWTGIARTSSDSRSVTGRSRSAAPGTNACRYCCLWIGTG